MQAQPRAETKPCVYVRARTVCGSTTHRGGSPLHRLAIPAQVWLLPFGQLSDGPSSAATAQPTTEPIPGDSPASAKHTTSIPSATSGLWTATSKGIFQLWQPIALRNRLPAKRSRTKTATATSKRLSQNPYGGWSCPSLPHGMKHEVFPASIPVQGTVAFCNNCGRIELSSSECIAPEHMRQEEQISVAWYAPPTNQLDGVGQDDQVRVISVAEAGGPSRPIVVTCGEKQVLITTLEAPAPNCTEILISIHLLLSAEQNLRPALR